MSQKDSPVFSRTQDLVAWLVQATRKFPRDQRFTLARRVVDKAFAVEDGLVAAALDRAAAARHLLSADIALTGLRRAVLLSHGLGLFSDGQLRHVTEMVAEVGRLLGAWRKSAPAARAGDRGVSAAARDPGPPGGTAGG